MHHPEAGAPMANSLLVSSSVLIGVTSFAVAVRVWARFYVVRVISLDDGTCVLNRSLCSISNCGEPGI